MFWIYLLIATNYIKILWDVLICLVCMKDFFSFMWFKLTGKIHSFSKQYFFSLLKQDPSASGGASLERSGEKDLVFIKGRFCRYCFKNEWTLASKVSQKIRFCRTFIWHLMPIHVVFWYMSNLVTDYILKRGGHQTLFLTTNVWFIN